MSVGLSRFVDRFENLKLLVVGEAMLDSDLHGASTRLCPEAPAPVLDVSTQTDEPGGAANAAVNAQALGACAFFLSVVGDDAEGDRLRERLEARGVSSRDVLVQRGRRTLAKRRLLAGDHLLLRCDQGDAGPAAPGVEEALLDRLDALWEACDAVLVSDYDYGVLGDRLISRLADLQRRAPRVLVVDGKRLPRYREACPTAVKPNFAGALKLLDEAAPARPFDRSEWAAGRGELILEATGARIAAVTMDVEGALVFERERPPYRTYARAEPSARSSGAGDTFAAALALALAAGADAPAAADVASAAAAVVVARVGTSACQAYELRERIRPAGKRIDDRRELFEQVEAHRRSGRRIVFTNGCFDILHRGHVSYLSRAKARGDVLIVAVNSDAGIRRLKGPERPINDLEDRLQVLSALSCVDHVVPFEDETPHALIRIVRPDVFVKGGDYTRERLSEAPLVEELGGVVEIMPFLAERSTTGIITKIRRGRECGDGLAAGVDGVAASLPGVPQADGASS